MALRTADESKWGLRDDRVVFLTAAPAEFYKTKAREIVGLNA